MTNSLKVTSVDASNLQPVELIHTKFAFYSVALICGFTPMLTFVCVELRKQLIQNRNLWNVFNSMVHIRVL